MISNRDNQTAIDILCGITDRDEMSVFLGLLFTEKEHKEIANRLKIFEMLLRKHPQREIAKALGVGISTVTRGSQALNRDGSEFIKRYLSM